ncbi:MAG TPA: PBP1A family penicillin-binding protein [Thermoanaerobaculia bacterium]|nr:PBP1A family penicillin-binding protein [Thermoanaerobaculia bacterium]
MSPPSLPARFRIAIARRPWLRWLLPALLALAGGSLVGMGVGAAIHMPKVETLAEFRPSLVTRLQDREGEVFTTYARERRELLAEGEMPPLLQGAVLAAEDADFFRHGGIDVVGVARAVLVNFQRGRRAQGASTITMQLARKLFLTPQKSWQRKIEEALLAVELEKSLSKQQILTLYCNLSFLGHGNYGMQSASRYYFGKPVAELGAAEAATLAGILQRPSEYSPYRRPELVTRRRNYVLDRMLAEGYLDPAAHAAAVAAPLVVREHRARAESGSYFAEEVRKQLEARFGAERLYGDGLRVRTTLDLRLQRATEEALRDGLLRLDHRRGWRGPLRRDLALDTVVTEDEADESRNPLPGLWLPGLVVALEGETARIRLPEGEATLTRRGVSWTGRQRVAEVLRPGDLAWFRWARESERREGREPPFLLLEQEPVVEGAAIVLESGTGAVRALVGGWNFARNKFNRATQAQRQVGSAFKPFVYGAAFEQGFSPADTLFDAPAAFLGADGLRSYSPRNYYRRYDGILTLRRALELSVNVPAVKLLDLIGVDGVVDFAHRAGIHSPLPPYPSLALGSADLVPMEVAAAYAAIANLGIHLEPYLIERVTTREGVALEEHQARASKVTEPEVAYVLLHVLEGVIDRGTAASAARLPLDLAGKTGTTNGYTDAWFVGMTPRYTILVWIGHDQKRSIGNRMTGAEAALPIWRAIVETGLAEGWLAEGERFSRPPGVVTAMIDYRSGLLATPASPRPLEEAFVPGTVPSREYEPRWERILELPWPQQRAFYRPRDREAMPEGVEDWNAIVQAWEAEGEE